MRRIAFNKATLVHCSLLAMICCALAGIRAGGEALSNDLRSRARELGEVYRSRAIELLQPYLDAKRFYVDVEVVPKVSGAVDLPYVPKNKLNFGANPNLIDDVQDLISSVRITLKLPADMTRESQQQIREILAKGLELDRWRGDSIQLRTMHFAEAKDKMDPVERPSLAQKPSVSDDPGTQATVLVGKQPWVSFESWMIPGLLLSALTAILGIFAIFAIIKVLRVIARDDARAQKFNVSSKAEGITIAAGDAGATSQSRDASRPKRTNTAGANRLPLQTAGSIQAQIRSFRSGLQSQFHSNPIAISCATELAARYLSHQDENDKILAMLDLIPESVGHEMYSRLSSQQQQRIQLAAQRFVSGHQLSLLAVAVGEELLSLIRSRTLCQSDSEYSHRIREFLARTNDDELAKLLPAINVDVLPRLLFYFDTERLTSILSQVRTSDGSFTNRLSWALVSLPAAERKSELDRPIVNLLDAMQELVKRRESMQYFPQLKSLIDSLPPQMRNQLRENVTSLSPDFAAFVNGRASSGRASQHQDESSQVGDGSTHFKTVA